MLSEAQEEYVASMRVSLRQVRAGEGRPLSALLEELRVEHGPNDNNHLKPASKRAATSVSAEVSANKSFDNPSPRHGLMGTGEPVARPLP